MSLFDIIPYKIHKGQQLLTKLHKSLFPAVIKNPNAKFFGMQISYRRRASFKLSKRLSCGSVSIEAAAAFPVILLLFLSFFWALLLFWVHTEIEAKLYSIGNEVVACSYAYSEVFSKENLDSDLINEIVSVSFNQGYVVKKLKESPAGKWTKNLNAILSDIKTSDTVDISVTYFVKPIMTVPGFKGVWLTNHFYSKSYTGFSCSKEKDIEDVIVYITKTGSVYHTSLACSSIKSKVDMVSKNDISKVRNKDKAKYYPCKKCSSTDDGNVVYITEYGNRYHQSINCSELKVDVYGVKLSEVNGRRKCRLCP